MNTDKDVPFATLKKTVFTTDGAYACITLEICDGSSEYFKITYDSYAEYVKDRSEFSPEDMDQLTSESDYCKALISALGSLAYGGNTQMELYRKLIKKRFPKEAALRAVKHIKKIGFIDEESIVREEIRACLGKQWGQSRIRARLISRGFGKKAFTIGMTLIEETDFNRICLECAKKKIKTVPETYEEKQKSVATLVRLGHTYDCARSAVELIADGEDFL